MYKIWRLECTEPALIHNSLEIIKTNDDKDRNSLWIQGEIDRIRKEWESSSMKDYSIRYRPIQDQRLAFIEKSSVKSPIMDGSIYECITRNQCLRYRRDLDNRHGNGIDNYGLCIWGR